MRHSYYASYKNIVLRPLEERDIEKLRIWRNDKLKTKYLRDIGEITPEMQKKWFQNYLIDQDEIKFAIEETKELKCLVGSVSLYNFHENMAEIGRIQIGCDEAHGKGIGRTSLVMAMTIGFEVLGVEKIVSCVHQQNFAAHKNNMMIGFQIIGSHEMPKGGYEDEIEIDEKRLREYNQYMDAIIVRC